VRRLEELYARINFPEYQREPNVWALVAKQRLVDSMLRQFDIAPLYLYDNEDGSYDCIDGRQRIGAILAFLGKNVDDADNGFALRTLNEIYTDQPPLRAGVEGMTYSQIKTEADKGDAAAARLISEFGEYQLTVVQLSGSTRAEEFNLQFTRLNVGTILNSGEKLNAMVGDMREVCFGEEGIGQHAFLERVNIPTRRFSREQLAAQILAQVFALKEPPEEYVRTRHFDLSRFFKEQATLDEKRRGWVAEVRRTLDVLAAAFVTSNVLRNRAMTVSTVLLAWKANVTAQDAVAYASFIEEFLVRLNWQVQKDLFLDAEYHPFLEFQRHVTQASVESKAVKARAVFLEQQRGLWESEKVLTGDREYKARTNKDPSVESRSGV